MMLKEIAIFSAGLLIGALGAGCALGWMAEEEEVRRIAMDEGEEDCTEESQLA